MGHWMNMNPWKNQTDVINGFDFIRKIEGSVIYEQVCISIDRDINGGPSKRTVLIRNIRSLYYWREYIMPYLMPMNAVFPLFYVNSLILCKRDEECFDMAWCQHSQRDLWFGRSKLQHHGCNSQIAMPYAVVNNVMYSLKQNAPS